MVMVMMTDLDGILSTVVVQYSTKLRPLPQDTSGIFLQGHHAEECVWLAGYYEACYFLANLVESEKRLKIEKEKFSILHLNLASHFGNHKNKLSHEVTIIIHRGHLSRGNPIINLVHCFTTLIAS